uniref:Uncharacterized protein n=1 Tax=Octopus bimaculoides TaxID=37653 RepID=A0A0L8GS21_OCTBM
MVECCVVWHILFALCGFLMSTSNILRFIVKTVHNSTHFSPSSFIIIILILYLYCRFIHFYWLSQDNTRKACFSFLPLTQHSLLYLSNIFSCREYHYMFATHCCTFPLSQSSKE